MGDHVALGSTRIVSTCMALGEAAGAALMLLLNEKAASSELDIRLLREPLRKQRALADEAAIVALSSQPGHGTPVPLQSPPASEPSEPGTAPSQE